MLTREGRIYSSTNFAHSPGTSYSVPVPYRFTCQLASNDPDKITILPRPSAPERYFYFYIVQVHFFCSDAAKSSHSLPIRTVSWNTDEYVQMILCYFYFLNFTIMWGQYLFRQFLDRILQLFCQCPFAIFGYSKGMVFIIKKCMAHSLYGHTVKYSTF